jgi:hypothetical protein
MISILASFKPFRGDAIRIQENALKNWRRLGSDVEIHIYGNGEGIAERARDYGARHVPDIACSDKGIPDFSAIAAHAARDARFDLQIYVNGDILLPPDLVHVARHVSFQRFLLVGQRIDLSKDADFNPVAPDWMDEMRRAARAGCAHLQGPDYQDYFVFPRGLWDGLAPLTIGRGGYDNALVAHCLRRRIPIIDATKSLHIVHQWHDYSHVTGFSEAYLGPDAAANKRLHDIEHSAPDIEDADWRLKGGVVQPSAGSSNPFRRLEVLLRYRWGLKTPSYVCRAITRLAWSCGCLKPRAWTLDSVLSGDAQPAERRL